MTYFSDFDEISDLKDRAQQKCPVGINDPSWASVKNWLTQICHIAPLGLYTMMTFLSFYMDFQNSILTLYENGPTVFITPYGNSKQHG